MVVMFGLGLVLGILGGIRPDAPSWLLVLVVLLLALPAIAWWQYVRDSTAGRWAVVLSLAIIIYLTALWSGLPGFLTLLAVPATLAATLIGLPAALGVATGETLVLLALPALAGGRVDLPATGVALAAIWMMVGAIYSAYRPIRQVVGWTWGYYQNAQARLEEAQSDRAALEQALADLVHANRQVSLANDRMAALRQAAEEARKSKETFAARVSHEFRAPLNVIIGMVSLMVERPGLYATDFSPRAMRHLRTVYQNCQHLSSMIDDVLDLSQADSGRMALRRQPSALAELVESSLAVVRPLLEQKGLALRMAVPADLPPVTCDRIRIRQVILNLLSNAARFTETGSITVTVSQVKSNAVISVADTGPGISPEDVGRIFEPFIQGQSDPLRIKGGSGLGLSISRQFVELHGGRIWAESRLGAGTTVFVELPLDEPAAPVAGPARWIQEDWIWHEGRSGPDLPRSQYRPRLVLCDETGDLYRSFTRLSEEVELVEGHQASTRPSSRPRVARRRP